ncbi:uncharacterized protein LOC143458639 [Clavelina lepadiformis]|uniref:uncharacterized protein LOC143458639 n=1 Tax=Clavelina lepadiformis TaxID=159417 RepID=UPI004040F930
MMEKKKQEVFSAAKEGSLIKLKNLLARKSRSAVKPLTSANVEKCTPLIIASKEGHFDVVEYLVTTCKCNVEQTGHIDIDNNTIEDVTPLWCAATCGHLIIVKFLIERGADPDHTTSNNSTPLRAACFDGHYDVVKFLIEKEADVEIANKFGNTCLMLASYFGHNSIVELLLQAGADINCFNFIHRTALHECQSVESAKLILKHKPNIEKDVYGLTPLHVAAIEANRKLFDFFLAKLNVTKVDKIEAHELIGAVFVEKKDDFDQGIPLWETAMKLRSEKPVVKLPQRSPVPTYGNLVEPSNLNELRTLCRDKEKAFTLSLLIRERIVGGTETDTSFRIRHQGARAADNDEFKKCIELSMYALKMQLNSFKTLHDETLHSIVFFPKYFTDLLKSPSFDETSLTKQGFVDQTKMEILDLLNSKWKSCDVIKEIDDINEDEAPLYYDFITDAILVNFCHHLKTQPQQAQGADITKHIAIFNKLCPPTRKNIEFYEINLNKLTEKLSSYFEVFKKIQKSDELKLLSELKKQVKKSEDLYKSKMFEKCQGLADDDFERNHEEIASSARAELEGHPINKESVIWKDAKADFERHLLQEKEIFKALNKDEVEVIRLKQKINEYKKIMDEAAKEHTYLVPSNKIHGVIGPSGFLGRGGYGKVRLAFTDSLGAVAIKCFSLTGPRVEIGTMKNKFMKEVELASKASHVNVVRVEGYTTWPDAMGVLLEFMPAGNLQSFLLGCNQTNSYCIPTIPAVIRLRNCADVASGMTFLHHGFAVDQRMTHGDLKPDNILLTADLRCKISDFGGADFATCTEFTSNRSSSGNTFTLLYAAPELLSSPSARPTKAMDIFCTSMIFRSVLARKPPVENASNRRIREAYLNSVQSGGRPDPDEVQGEFTIPEDIEIINLLKDEMKKCWAHDPAQRPSMMQSRDNLFQLLSRQDVKVVSRHVSDIIQHMEVEQPFRHQCQCATFDRFTPPSFEYNG